MTAPETQQPGAEAEQQPEHLPPKAWVTLVGFAVFVVLTSSCMVLFVFD